MIVLAWNFQRDRLADSLGRLRRRHEPDEYERILADRAASALDAIDAFLEPTAAELVRDGWNIDAALERVDRHRARLYHRMGGRP